MTPLVVSPDCWGTRCTPDRQESTQHCPRLVRIDQTQKTRPFTYEADGARSLQIKRSNIVASGRKALSENEVIGSEGVIKCDELRTFEFCSSRSPETRQRQRIYETDSCYL